MAQIGLVTKQKDGSFVGKLKTLSIDADIRIVPVKKKEKESHPDFRISCKGIDVGAAWLKEGKESGKEYISASVSAPEFGTLYFNLGKAAGQDDEDVMALIWNEKK
jgi:uncharacterized protein (DUF736 family)